MAETLGTAAGPPTGTDVPEGTIEGLLEILQALHPHVEKRQPKPCKPIVDRLTFKS